MNDKQIRIGTMVNGGPNAANYIRQILPHGFESFSISFWQTLGDTDLMRMADEVKAELEGSDAIISSLSVFGNPLMDDEIGCHHPRRLGQTHRRRRGSSAAIWSPVSPDASSTSPSTPACRATKKSSSRSRNEPPKKGVRLAFENCDMGGTWQQGDWNIAQTPIAWDMMFETLPDG